MSSTSENQGPSDRKPRGPRTFMISAIALFVLAGAWFLLSDDDEQAEAIETEQKADE